jgi:hypothetical protein
VTLIADGNETSLSKKSGRSFVRPFEVWESPLN